MKKILIISLCVLLMLCLPIAAFAADVGTPLVSDSAEILSVSELSKLENLAAQIQEKYGITAAICITDTFYSYTPAYYAEVTQLMCGYQDGILLVVAINSRDYCLHAFDKGTAVFTDYGLKKLEDVFLPDLKNDAFYDGFCAYLNAVAQYCEAYNSGKPVDRSLSFVHVLIALLIGAAVGGITVAIMRSCMKTAKAKPAATEYVCPGSFRPYGNFDMYLYSHVSRVRRQQNNSSGGHGGGHSGSSRSRSGKF